MTIDVVLVDDEPHSREELSHLLSSYEQVQLVGEAGSAEEALDLIVKKEPDVIFLDIEMPRMTGMELARIIQQLKKSPLIVFATAYPDYAAKAFRVQAFDYLVKPFDDVELDEVMERLKNQFDQKKDSIVRMERSLAKPSKLAIEEEGRIVYISPEKILYVVREGRETKICQKEKSYRTKATLKEVRERLKEYPFLQTHKSYLVNLEQIDELIPWFNGAYQVRIKGSKDEIPVSRNYVKSLREGLEL